jgi:hypothetical protein
LVDLEFFLGLSRRGGFLSPADACQKVGRSAQL